MQEKDFISNNTNEKDVFNRNNTFNNIKNKVELNLDKCRSSKTFNSNNSLNLISLSVASKNAISQTANNFNEICENENKGISFLSNDSMLKDNNYKSWISYPSKKSFFSTVFQANNCKEINDNQDMSLIDILEKSRNENNINENFKSTNSISNCNKQTNNLMNYYFGDIISKNKNSNLDSSSSAFSFKIQTSLEISKMSKISHNTIEKDIDLVNESVDDKKNVNFNNFVTNEKSAELSYENFSYMNEFMNNDTIINDNNNLSNDKISKEFNSKNDKKNTPTFDKFHSINEIDKNTKNINLNLKSFNNCHQPSKEFENFNNKFDDFLKSKPQINDSNQIKNNTFNLNYNFFNIQGSNFQSLYNLQSQYMGNNMNSNINNMNSEFKNRLDQNNNNLIFEELQRNFANMNFYNNTENKKFNKYEMDSKKKHYKVENDPTIYNKSDIIIDNVSLNIKR